MRSETTLERDLSRWEAGELSLEELQACAPDGGVRELVELHERLAATVGEPVPEPEASWETLRSRLPDRVPETGGGRRTMPARRLLLAVAATLLVGGIAYAAAPKAVSERLGELWDRVRSAFVAEPPASPGVTGDVPPETKDEIPATLPVGLDPSGDEDAAPDTGDTDEADATNAGDVEDDADDGDDADEADVADVGDDADDADDADVRDDTDAGDDADDLEVDDSVPRNTADRNDGTDDETDDGRGE